MALNAFPPIVRSYYNTTFNDFVAMSNNFEISFSSGSNVPEPAMLGDLGLLSLMLLRRLG